MTGVKGMARVTDMKARQRGAPNPDAGRRVSHVVAGQAGRGRHGP